MRWFKKKIRGKKQSSIRIFFSISIIIRLFEAMSEWRFYEKINDYRIHTTVPPRIVLLKDFFVEQVPSVAPTAS